MPVELHIVSDSTGETAARLVQALAHLPEDLQVYSSAQNDITRALQTRIADAKPAHLGDQDNKGGTSPFLVVAITAGILVAAGSVAAAFR